MTEDLSRLENSLKYNFKDVTLLRKALTHPSVSKDNYEILEFLGDSLLDFIVADHLLKVYPEADEEFATKQRANIVSRYPLADYFDRLSLLRYLNINGVNVKTMSVKLKSNVVEAIIGAIYKDGGLDAAEKFIVENFCTKIANTTDYKSKLFEYAAKNKSSIRFEYIEEGEDHKKSFYAFVYVDDKESGSGFGKKKIDAEQIACKVALENLNVFSNVKKR